MGFAMGNKLNQIGDPIPQMYWALNTRVNYDIIGLFKYILRKTILGRRS